VASALQSEHLALSRLALLFESLLQAKSLSMSVHLDAARALLERLAAARPPQQARFLFLVPLAWASQRLTPAPADLRLWVSLADAVLSGGLTLRRGSSAAWSFATLALVPHSESHGALGPRQRMRAACDRADACCVQARGSWQR